MDANPRWYIRQFSRANGSIAYLGPGSHTHDRYALKHIVAQAFLRQGEGNARLSAPLFRLTLPPIAVQQFMNIRAGIACLCPAPRTSLWPAEESLIAQAGTAADYRRRIAAVDAVRGDGE